MEDEHADRVYVPGTNPTPPARDVEPFWAPEELEAPVHGAGRSRTRRRRPSRCRRDAAVAHAAVPGGAVPGGAVSGAAVWIGAGAAACRTDFRAAQSDLRRPRLRDACCPGRGRWAGVRQIRAGSFRFIRARVRHGRRAGVRGCRRARRRCPRRFALVPAAAPLCAAAGAGRRRTHVGSAGSAPGDGSRVGSRDTTGLLPDRDAPMPQALWNTATARGSRLIIPRWSCTSNRSTGTSPPPGCGTWAISSATGWIPDAPPEDRLPPRRIPSVVATACLYRSASFAAEAAAVLGKTDDARRCSRAGGTHAERHSTSTMSARRGMGSDCATVYALAISFRLARRAGPEPRRQPRSPRSYARTAGYTRHHGVRRHPVRHLGPLRDGPSLTRPTAAPGAPEPVVALPRDHGRHHDLGALGFDAARRHDQPR